MDQAYVVVLFLFVLFTLLGTGVWVGLALVGVAYVGMELFASGPTGDRMATTIWAASSTNTSRRTAAASVARSLTTRRA